MHFFLRFKCFNVSIAKIKVLIFSIVFFSFTISKISAQKPDTICHNSDVFCDSLSMVGPWELLNHKITNYEDFRICAPNGIPQNSLFFAFVANSTEVKIEIIPETIVGNSDGNGYQYTIIDRCPTEFSSDFDGQYMDCDATQKITTSRIVGNTNFIPGHTYYLMIDGDSGSFVKFRLNVLKGIGDFTVDPIDSFRLTGSDTIFCTKGDTITACVGSKYEILAQNISNAQVFEWKTQDSLENSDSLKLTYSFQQENQVYKICSQAFTDCRTNDLSCFYVRTDTIETIVLDTVMVCSSQLFTVGVEPDFWHGGIIKKEGTSFYHYTEDFGCKTIEQITIVEGEEPIYIVDSIICDANPLLNDTSIRKNLKTTFGCDSIVDQNLYYFNFDGKITKLKCSNDSLLLNIDTNNFDESMYSKIKIVWLDQDNTPVKLFSSFKPFNVKKAGKYTAEVTLYKKNGLISCSYMLNEVIVEKLPSAKTIVSADTICSSDTLFFQLKNYIDTLIYNINIDKGTVYDKGNGEYFVIWNKGEEGVFDLNINTEFEGCLKNSTTEITVMPELNTPIVDCIDNTNSTITFGWENSSCVKAFEVWVDGSIYNTISDTFITINGLSYGQTINIEVVALSECGCGSKSSEATCSTINCPNIDIEIMNIPNEICLDELPETIELSYRLDTTGIVKWGGDLSDESGLIKKEDITDGIHLISIEYKVGDCIYKKDTNIVIYPFVNANWIIQDLSCYDSEDGQLWIIPEHGTPEYSLNINNKTMDSLHLINLLNGDYNILLEDANGCKYLDTVAIEVPDEPEFKIEGSEKVIFNKEFKYNLMDITIEPDSVIWYYNMDSVLCSSNCDTLKIIPNSDFELCASVYYDSICSKTTCINVRIDRDFDIYVPNIFTPDFGTDKLNSNFFISSTNGLSLNIKTFKVFNRWGELLFNKGNFIIDPLHSFAGWNGIYKGKIAPSGVYVYYIEVLNDNGEISKFSGDVTLIR